MIAATRPTGGYLLLSDIIQNNSAYYKKNTFFVFEFIAYGEKARHFF